MSPEYPKLTRKRTVPNGSYEPHAVVSTMPAPGPSRPTVMSRREAQTACVQPASPTVSAIVQRNGPLLPAGPIINPRRHTLLPRT